MKHKFDTFQQDLLKELTELSLQILNGEVSDADALNLSKILNRTQRGWISLPSFQVYFAKTFFLDLKSFNDENNLLFDGILKTKVSGTYLAKNAILADDEVLVTAEIHVYDFSIHVGVLNWKIIFDSIENKFSNPAKVLSFFNETPSTEDHVFFVKINDETRILATTCLHGQRVLMLLDKEFYHINTTSFSVYVIK